MKQGTISVLFGCHSVLHSICVARAWRKLYGRLPAPWEAVCILLHDVGHWGKDYLDDVEQKKQHWILGARIAGRLFGPKGYELVAGHCTYSGVPASPMLKADKYSYLVTPRWYLITNLVVEPKIRNNGMTRGEHVDNFLREVRDNIESERWGSTHDIYLKQKRWKQNAS